MRLRSLIGVAVATVALSTGSIAQAHAEEGDATTPPYGGCAEVTQDFPSLVHTAGADWCRAHGWTIRRHFVISPRNRLIATDFRPCAEEDSNGCYWNANRRGNGYGSSFVVTPRGRVFYVAGW